jgi:hypothetical protein
MSLSSVRASETDARSTSTCWRDPVPALTNRRPYPNGKDAPRAKCSLASPVLSPCACCADAPVELVAICEKAMQREPRKRFASMDEMARDRAFLV